MLIDGLTFCKNPLISTSLLKILVILSPIHSQRKQNFFLMFLVNSLIFFVCGLTFVSFPMSLGVNRSMEKNSGGFSNSVEGDQET